LLDGYFRKYFTVRWDLAFISSIFNNSNLLLRRSQRSPLLEALPAKHRASLRRPEGNGRLFPALRAGRLRLCPHLSPAATAFRALCFARFTSFGLVLKALVREKHLLAGCKYKFGAAFRTLQDLVMEFHLPHPP
jgi:hypothetical protein